MPDLRSLAGAELSWVRSRYTPAGFSLRWHEDEVGSVNWERLFSSGVLLRVGESGWRLRREGFRTFGIDRLDDDAWVGSLILHPFGSADVTFADGRQVTLRRAAFLPPTWVFRNEYDADLVTLRGRIATLFRGGTCRIEPAGAGLPEIDLLSLLGIFVMVRRARQRARR